METTLDLRRWQEKPLGVAYRRWVIVSTGLRQLMRTRSFKILLFLAWIAGVLMAVAGFVFTQSLASGGWLETWAASLGPKPQAIVSAFCAMVLLYPDICIGGLFTSVFWWHSFIGLFLCLVALSNVVPNLITRDRASNALTIYLSRPLTTVDYLLGKLGIIVGIILVLWTGPLLFGWLLSMAFAPGGDFFVYSLLPLGRALLFNFIGLVTLAAVALGVSSLGKTSRTVVPLWMGVWIVALVLANIPTTPNFLRAASFQRDLNILRQSIFRVDEVLIKAGETLPLVNRSMARNLVKAGQHEQSHDAAGAAVGLAALVAVSSVVFSKKLRPE
jgi:hypothetical protein